MYLSVLCTASGQRLSIAARIEQFYREVKQKSKELCGENEYDTRYIHSFHNRYSIALFKYTVVEPPNNIYIWEGVTILSFIARFSV